MDAFREEVRPAGVTDPPLGTLAPSLFVPRLAMVVGEARTLFEPEELDHFSWNLDECGPKLSRDEFADDVRVGTAATIDLAGEAIVSASAGEVRLRQLELIGEGDDWTDVELARWLDRELHRDDTFLGLPKGESQPWMRRVVDGLVRGRGLSLPVVVRRRHDLAQLLRTRVAAHGRARTSAAAEELIRSAPAAVETSAALVFEMSEGAYAPYTLFERHDFHKHAFDRIAAMNGDEAECAARIDRHPAVKRWVRNPDRETQGGFWLPKSPGRFFPDFVVELEGGVIAVVEYKNAKINSDPEEQHKKAVGELWAGRSDGRCRFGWVVEKNWAEVDRTLGT